MTLFLDIARKFGGWILGIGSLILSVWFAMRQSKKVGQAEANVEAAKQMSKANEAVATKIVNDERAENEKRVESVKSASDVDKDISAMSTTAVADKLRDDWKQPSK